MRRYFAVCLLASLVLPAVHAQKKPVTIEATAVEAPSGPGSPVWAQDGKRFVYTEDKGLWLYDVPSRAKNKLVPLEALSNAASKVPEPERFGWQNRGVREQAVQWMPDGTALLVSAGGDLFLFRVEAGGWTQLTATTVAETDPKASPDGRYVSFRRAHDLYVLEIASKNVTRLTHDGSSTLLNAELDWVYPEELGLGTAHWWSPDSKWIAYLQFDVSRQPLYPQADLIAFPARYEPERYPKAGDPNADVRLGVVSPTGGGTRWMDLGQTRDVLYPRFAWLPDSQRIAAVRTNRIQNRLDILVADVETGGSTKILTETDPYWLEAPEAPRFLKDGKEFLWLSERDGFFHIYRYTADGRQAGQLTKGDWGVSSIAGVDEKSGRVFFTGAAEGPLETHLYSVGLDGRGQAKLTRQAGSHVISMGPTCEFYLDNHSSLTEPLRGVLHKADGAEVAVFREADRKPLEEYDIRPSEIVRVKAADGETLYAKLIRPAGFEAGRKYPAVAMVYGGPHAQSVRNAWAGLSLEQALAHKGFVVWQLDNRGTGGRGHKWESAVFRNLGAKELEDQKEGVRHLLSLGFVDAARVGIYGWSYGGFMTLYSLLHAPDMFAAGVAGAPVTDWRHYDTIYTERYMGLPSENPEGYKRSAPLNAAGNLNAKLMLIHNFEDDNVLFQNTMRMADALEREDKLFEMVIYPQKAHGVTGPARKHLNRTIVSFFERTLK